MIESDFEWLAERARSGNPSDHAYSLSETYIGERADLVRELRTALAGCPDTHADTFATMMQQAVHLNALPVLRAVVSLWRDAYRDLLDQPSLPQLLSDGSAEGCVLLTSEERLRLTAFKRELKHR